MEQVFNYASAFLFNFIVILLIIELVFCWGLKKRKKFWLRLLVFLPYIYVFHTMIADYGPFFYWGKFSDVPIFIWGPFNVSYLIEFLISVLLLWFCFDEAPRRMFFYCSAAYVVQNLGHNVMELIRTSAWSGDPYSSSGIGEAWYYYFVKYLVFLALIVFVKLLVIDKYKKNESIRVDSLKTTLFVIACLALSSIFNRITYDYKVRNFTTYIAMIVINIFLLVIQFSAFEKQRVDTENEIYNHMLYLQAKQFEQSKENADALNRKCHDLKYQIAALKKISADTQEKEKIVAGLEKVAADYDSKIKTGDETLDIILSEKARVCEARGIQFYCMAEGNVLNFIEKTDLYALLGNALDNAIEAMDSVTDPENKIINVSLLKKSNVVRLCVDNYLEKDVALSGDGLPITTKSDKLYHGFGTRNIKSIIEKYHGQMLIDTKKHHYVLLGIFLQA